MNYYETKNGMQQVGYDGKDTNDLKPICELKPFDRVLVRDKSGFSWDIDIFRCLVNYTHFCFRASWQQCIPYNEETKDLLGTSNDCPAKYKTW
jgi:hypothetical protein